jgi:hypothetical protein
MKSVDVDKILAENPGLDQEVFKRNQKKIDATKHLRHRSQSAGHRTGPYGGRRLLTDDHAVPRNEIGKRGYSTG